MENKKIKKRIWELDFLRGLAILMMVFDHLMFDFAYLKGYFSNFYEVNNSMFNWLNDLGIMYWNSTLRFIGREFFVLLFLLISGISFTFSKDNLKRGLKLLIVAIVITLVTYLVDQFLNFGVLIVFGVIHMFAVNTLLTVLIRKLIKNEIFILLLGMLILTFSFIYGLFTPPFVSLSFENLPKIILGFGRFGADHFGVFPYLGIILIGTVVGQTFYKNRLSLMPQVNLSQKNVFLLAGRYSLYIYVVHQPVVLLFVSIFAYIFGYRF
ncbi:MAG: heparan-alpha-glucosaminide N-acetyltransferase domain-containing protein [Candidatus Izemoplasmatales bacterium]